MVHPSGLWIIDWQICYVEIRQTPPLPDFPRFLPQFLPRPAIRYLIMNGQQSRVRNNGDQYDQVNRNLYKTDIEQVGRRSEGATAQSGQGTPVSSYEFRELRELVDINSEKAFGQESTRSQINCLQIEKFNHGSAVPTGLDTAGRSRWAAPRPHTGNHDAGSIVMETMTETKMKSAPIAYTDSGAGEPVVLIHCSSASSAEWESLRNTLDEDFRVIASDQWGCGESDPWTGQSEFNLAQEAAPIFDIIGRIGDAVHLIGHSYGGGVALHIAREHPDLIRSLTLIEPSAFHLLRAGNPENRTLFREISSVADTVREAVLSGDCWGGMARFVDYWNGEGAWNAMSQKARIKLGRNLSKVVLDFYALFEEPALLEDYAALSIPTLLLCGECSPAPSCRIIEILASSMPHSRAVQIQGAGHMSPFTHSDTVNAAIGAHLRQHGAGITHRAA